ncbi:MAG: diguanylate cyclase [Oscillospiraceae bacterium]|nr:diguanylate cyclase [Oscillospiraceae bacterium]
MRAIQKVSTNEPKEKNSILIIDDDAEDVLAMAAMLKGEYTVYSKRNGQEGVRFARKVVPDVILLNIAMPEMDSYEVLLELKAVESTKNIPIIFITGVSEADNETKGLIMGAADYITKPFVPDIVKLRVKNQVLIVNQLRIVEQLGMTDKLTGLPSRRYFEPQFKTEWARAQREKTPLSLLVLDIDGFSQYNEVHGGRQGDEALKAFSQVFADSLRRPADFAVRWERGKFVALLPNTDSDGSLVVAETIRKKIEDLVITRYGKVRQEPRATDRANEAKASPPGSKEKSKSAAKITVSVGTNTRTHEDDMAIDEFFDRADKALYAAKDSGRNKCVRYIDLV